jgi:hypothetical protein
MTQLAFGSGSVWGINSISNPTPARFGVTQEMSVDFSAKTVPIFGQNNLPVSVAKASLQTKGKITFGQFNGRVINELFFGATSASGQRLTIDSESGTIPTTPYQITVANAATFSTDLGVVYASGANLGLPLVRVASAPATGQYSVNTATGVYTFAAADTTIAVKISYDYTSASAGNTITIAQQAMGTANTFKTVMSLPYNGQKAQITLNACVSAKLSLATKLEDFVKPSFEFEAFADASGNLGTISVAEIS